LESRVDELKSEKEQLEDDLQAERQNNETVQQLADKLTAMSSDDGLTGVFPVDTRNYSQK